MSARILLAAAVALGASACAPRSAVGYHWGRYDEALYHHYKKPQEREAWVEQLKTTIQDAEQRGMKVPPGLYAEYGFALYEEGRPDLALPWFQKEKAKWPESAALMDKMIRNAERRAAAGPAKAQGPAGALEKTR